MELCMFMYVLMLMCNLAFSANAIEHRPTSKASEEQSMQVSTNQPCRCCNHSNTDGTKIDQEAFNKDIENQIVCIKAGLSALAITGIVIVMVANHLYFNLDLSISNLKYKIKAVKRLIRR